MPYVDWEAGDLLRGRQWGTEYGAIQIAEESPEVTTLGPEPTGSRNRDSGTIRVIPCPSISPAGAVALIVVQMGWRLGGAPAMARVNQPPRRRRTLNYTVFLAPQGRKQG